MKVLLIDIETIKNETPIAVNTDECYILPAIESVQDIFLAEILSEKLYNKIQDMVLDGTITKNENAVYKNLLDEYIQPFIKQKCTAELTLQIAFKYRNAGVVQTDNEYVKNSVMKDAQILESHYNELADFYGLRLKNKLKELFGCQCIDKCECGDKISNDSGFDCGIFLD